MKIPLAREHAPRSDTCNRTRSVIIPAMQRVILTASGTDRPGIIDELSKYILERGGSIEDSRMVSLHGQVAMLLLVAAAAESVPRIRDDIGQLASASRLCTELHDIAEGSTDRNTFAHRLVVTGPEQTGVVHRFSHLMRVLNINIDQFEIRGQPARDAQQREFSMEMILAVPRETPVSMLRDYITHIAQETGLEFQLKAL
jgi:glycine cleavage system transcriptional repressor